jgi:hypothetical protein
MPPQPDGRAKLLSPRDRLVNPIRGGPRTVFAELTNHKLHDIINYEFMSTSWVARSNRAQECKLRDYKNSEPAKRTAGISLFF